MRVLAILLAVAVGFASPAKASVIISSITPATVLTGSITLTSAGAKYNNVSIGRYKVRAFNTKTATVADYFTYCVDIFHTAKPGTFTTPGLETYITNPVKLTQLTALVTNAWSLVGNATSLTAMKNNAAALQLAIWEIIYEAGTTSYSVTNGKFYSSGSALASAQTIANSWLGKVTQKTWKPVANKKLTLLYNSKSQSQITIGPVPEPAQWAMMIAGFGLLGVLARFRRRAIPRHPGALSA